MKTLLFVCTGNTCRSPMAEALFDELIDDHPRLRGKVRCESAGTMACDGARITEFAKNALVDMGVDASRHRAQQLTAKLADNADLILTMEAQHLDELEAICPQADHKAHTLMGYVAGVEGFPGDGEFDIEDPFRGQADDYEEVAAEIKAAISKLIEKLDGEMEDFE